MDTVVDRLIRYAKVYSERTTTPAALSPPARTASSTWPSCW